MTYRLRLLTQPLEAGTGTRACVSISVWARFPRTNMAWARCTWACTGTRPRTGPWRARHGHKIEKRERQVFLAIQGLELGHMLLLFRMGIGMCWKSSRGFGVPTRVWLREAEVAVLQNLQSPLLGAPACFRTSHFFCTWFSIWTSSRELPPLPTSGLDPLRFLTETRPGEIRQVGSSIIGALDTSPQDPFCLSQLRLGSSSLAFGEALALI